MTSARTGVPDAPGAHEGLEDQRDLLLASLTDLEREHEAGDLSDADYIVLRDRYTARAAAVLRAIETGIRPDESPTDEEPAELDQGETGRETRPQQPQDTRRRPRSKKVAIVAATGCVALIAGSIVLVIHATSSRLPGQTVSGSVSLSSQQQVARTLSQAETLESQGNASEALALYRRVLQSQPDQTEALAETGWLEFEAGAEAKNSKLLSQGQSEEQKAERSNPAAYTPHLYLGSMFLVENDATDSVSQYRMFLADNPPSSVVSSAAQFIRRAFADAHLAAPSLPSGS